MKIFLLLLSVFLTTNVLISQNTDTDVIYPLHNDPPIKGCKIIDIVHGNVVVYTKYGDKYRIKAISVKRNGEFINLTSTSGSSNSQSNNDNSGIYRGQNYEYYHNIKQNAAGRKTFGVLLTLFGIGGMVGAQVYAAEGGDLETAQILDIVGFISFNIGIPLWISGGIKNKNNKKAMQKCQNSNYSLNFGQTQHGIGLAFRF